MMAKSTTTPKTTGKKRGRKPATPSPDAPALPERTTFPLRLAADVLRGLDLWVSQINTEPGRIGVVARSHLVEKIITDAVHAHFNGKVPAEGEALS